MNELLGWYGYDSVEITKNKMQQNRPNGNRERSSSPSYDSSRENSTSPSLPIITTEKRGKYFFFFKNFLYLKKLLNVGKYCVRVKITF